MTAGRGLNQNYKYDYRPAAAGGPAGGYERAVW
jgi:hypothetical protein